MSTKDLARVLRRDMLQEDDLDGDSHEYVQRGQPGYQPVFIHAWTLGRMPEGVGGRWIADMDSPGSGAQRVASVFKLRELPTIARSHFKPKQVVSITARACSHV